MNGLASLPGIPESALDGLPPPEDLPTEADRRRYARALACALAGEKGYELTVWKRSELPLFLKMRAQQEDWPAVGTAAVVTLIQPAPLPDSPGQLFMRAIARVPDEMKVQVGEQLACLWMGDTPPQPSAAVQAFLGQTMFEAGRAARDEAFEAAKALAEELRRG